MCANHIELGGLDKRQPVDRISAQRGEVSRSVIHTSHSIEFADTGQGVGAETEICRCTTTRRGCFTTRRGGVVILSFIHSVRYLTYIMNERWDAVVQRLMKELPSEWYDNLLISRR